MIQFHESGYGRTFFEHQLPELTYQLERIANALEEKNQLEKENRPVRRKDDD